MGVLVRREFFRERAAILAEAALRLAPGSAYYVVEQNGVQVGFASSTIDTTTTSFEVTDYIATDISDANERSRATTRSTGRLSRSLVLREFQLTRDSDTRSFTVNGSAEGDSVIVLALQPMGGERDSQRVAVQGPMMLPSLVPAVAVLTRAPKVGRRVVVPTFDPATQSGIDLHLRFTAESLFSVVDSAAYDPERRLFYPALIDTVRAWKLESDDSTQFSGWVDAQGRIVESSQDGMTIRRMAYEIAFENWRRIREGLSTPELGGGISQFTAITAGAEPSETTRDRMRFRLSGTDLSDSDLHGGQQTLADDILTVRRATEGQLNALWSLASQSDEMRTRFADQLRPEPLLQSNSPQVVSLAVRLAGSDRDPRIIAGRIVQVLSDSLRKEASSGSPNAAQVLRTRRGDSPEHAQLFTALARSIGIPARTATGLLYINGSFYYHVWSEIWLNDWVAVDPTFGQFPADATRIRFVSGAPVSQTEFMRMISSLSLEVLEGQ